MEIDDTFKNKSSAALGKKRITHLKGKEKKVPMCQNRAFIYCPIYYSLSKISISLTFPFSPLYKTCCGGALEVLCNSRSKLGYSYNKKLAKVESQTGKVFCCVSI